MATPNVLYGTCIGTAPGGIHPFSLKLVLGETVNQQANTSVIPWALYCFVNKSDYITGYHYSGNNMVTVQIGGLNVFPRQNVGDVRLGDGTQAGTHYESNPVLLASGTTSPIQHGDNGKKTITVYAKYEQSSAAYLQSITISANVDLTKIQRGAEIDVTPSDITLVRGSNVDSTLEWTDVLDYYYKVQYLYGDTILHTSSAIAPGTEEYTWSVPGSVAEYEINSKTMLITVALHTYEDSACTQEVGVNSVKITFTIGSSYAPFAPMPPTFTDVDAVNGALVAGISTRTADLQNITYYAGAVLSNAYAVWTNSSGTEVSERVVGNLPITLNVLPAFTDTFKSYKIEVGVTDSRGYSFSIRPNNPFTVFGWIAPTITDLTAWRCDANGDPNDRGNYFSVKFTYSIRTLGMRNSKNSKVKYKWLGESNYSQAASGAMSNYETTVTLGPYQLQNPQDEKLEIRVEVSDALSADNPTYSDFTILPADVFIDIMTAGTRDDKKIALGIGIMADEDETIRSAWKLKMWDQPLEIYDDLGVLRVSLDFTNGLRFYNSSGAVIGTYPINGSGGSGGGGGSYNVESVDNGDGTQNLIIVDATYNINSINNGNGTQNMEIEDA